MAANLELEAFVEAALSDKDRAREMLAAQPETANADFYAALVLGDAAAVGKAVAETPEMVNRKGGPRGWEPLLYVCFSRVGAAGLADTAGALLRHGADPNASYSPEEWPDNPLSCLYGATGLNNSPALGLVLLEAGANPNDSESLYHSTEHPDLACVKLLLAHGASTVKTNALKHMLDREDMEGLRLLLDAGADPNEVNESGETALHWAVWRGRSVDIVAQLLDRGAAIDARREDGRTAYALAVQSGREEVAQLLESRGASKELSALDRFIGECALAGPEELGRLISQAPQILTSPRSGLLIPHFASAHRTSAVGALLAAGLPVDSRGGFGATALHWACWRGYADLVTLLLDHGASTTIEDEKFHASPLGWFDHGKQNCYDDRGDYVATETVLRERGLLG